MFYQHYLAHHGVQGQKWGVRKGPPYPIEDPILKAGTRLNSVRAFKVSTHCNTVYTYNPDDDWDSRVYKGAYSLYMLNDRHAPGLYEHRYEVVKDLKMPTRKEREDGFQKIYKKNKFRSIKELTLMQNNMVRWDMGTERAKTVNLKKLKTPEDWAAAKFMTQ